MKKLDNLGFFKDKEILEVTKIHDMIRVHTKQGIYGVRQLKNVEDFDCAIAEKNWRQTIHDMVPNINLLYVEELSDGTRYSVKRQLTDGKEKESLKVQYQKGREVGAFLRDYHDRTKKKDEKTWEKSYQFKIDLLYHDYSMQEFRGDKDYMIFDFIHAHRYLLEGREISNILCVPSFSAIQVEDKVIDYPMMPESYIGDPVFEFWRMNLDYYYLKGYYYGILKGYYYDRIPRIFYKLLALYTVVETLNSVYQKQKVSDTLLQLEMEELAKIYSDFSTVKPGWVIECEQKGEIFR